MAITPCEASPTDVEDTRFGKPAIFCIPCTPLRHGTIGQSVTLYGVNEYDMFGSTVSAAGDVDGDGIDDVLVSATAFRVDGDPVGRSFLIYGRETWPANMSVSSLPLSEGRAIVDDAGGSFGDSLSSLGDINNDGYADFAVGAQSRHQHSKGQLLGFLGRPRNATTSVSFTINGNDRNENLAGSIAGVGDVDNDGYHDFVIGAPSTHSSFNEYGRAYLIFGGPSAPLNGTFDIQDILANDQGVRFSTNVLGSWLGVAVAPAGDRNNDGFADFLIGAPWQALDSGPIDGQYDLQAGRVYLICGRARNNSASTGLLDQSPIDVATGSCSQILGSSEEEQLGYTMSPAGSLDGDVYDDFVLSSFMRDFPGMERAGAAYIFRGNMVPSSTSSAAATGNVGTTYRGDYRSLRLGTSIDGGGDVDGDGVPDVLIASAWDTSTSPYLGAAYIVFGGRGALPTASPSPTGTPTPSTTPSTSPSSTTTPSPSPSTTAANTPSPTSSPAAPSATTTPAASTAQPGVDQAGNAATSNGQPDAAPDNTGAIVGGVLGAVAGVALVVVGVLYMKGMLGGAAGAAAAASGQAGATAAGGGQAWVSNPVAAQHP